MIKVVNTNKEIMKKPQPFSKKDAFKVAEKIGYNQAIEEFKEFISKNNIWQPEAKQICLNKKDCIKFFQELKSKEK